MPLRTSDVHLSAYLMALEYGLTPIEGPKDRRTFHFNGVPADVVADFYTEGQAPARRLFESYKSLRKLMSTQA